MRTWMFCRNPFLNADNDSYINAMAMSIHHDSALAAAKDDVFFLVMYQLYHPIHLLYKAAYDNWISQGGKQQGKTLNIYQLLDKLANSKIRDWDIHIQSVYPIDTSEYKELLPNHRKPFQKGRQIKRIHEVKALINSIGDNEALTTLKADIVSFYTLLDIAYRTQKESKSTTTNKSSEVEKARVAVCVAQYKNLGSLIQKYGETPEVIEQYFDLKAIRRSKQVSFTGQLKASAVYTIVKHTFGENDQVILSNTGTTTLKFYLARVKDAQPEDLSVTLVSGEQTVSASTLGKLTDTYLCVLNLDPLYAGAFGVRIV